jgi:hypothetical protein
VLGSVVVLLAVAALGLIAFALHKKDYVKATVNLRLFGFSIEAGNNRSPDNAKVEIK